MRHLEALTLLVCIAVIGAATGLLAAPATAKEASSVTDLLDRVADVDAHYRAKQLVVSFGAKESAAVLDVQSSPEGRFVRAESGHDVAHMWTKSDATHLTQVAMRPEGVLTKYAVEATKPEELLGVDLIPLTLIRRADAALAERWWVHEASGVVYKRELFDSAGNLAGLATIIEMDWGSPGQAAPLSSDVATTSAADADAPDAPKELAGGYAFWRAYGFTVDDRPAEQWVYSDGLHALSVFRTDGALEAPDGFTSSDVDGHRVWTGPGPGTWAWEGDGHSFLVVAEEAAIDAADLLEPFPAGGRSILERLGGVWSRLFSALGSLFD